MPALIALHTKLDAILDSERASAEATGDVAAVERCDVRKRLNDQAYFVMCWGQLEAEIDKTSRTAIRKRRDDADWQVRRAWDLYNPDDRRLSGLSFEDRAGMVTDRSAGSGSCWALIMRYYQIRNQIAHGNLRFDTIDMASVTKDFYKIQSEIQQ